MNVDPYERTYCNCDHCELEFCDHFCHDTALGGDGEDDYAGWFSLSMMGWGMMDMDEAMKAVLKDYDDWFIRTTFCEKDAPLVIGIRESITIDWRKMSKRIHYLEGAILDVAGMDDAGDREEAARAAIKGEYELD